MDTLKQPNGVPVLTPAQAARSLVKRRPRDAGKDKHDAEHKQQPKHHHDDDHQIDEYA